MNSFAEKQNKIEERVKVLLEKYPKCKENDLWLIIKFWQEMDDIKVYIPYAVVENKNISSPESITRARRKIQSSGILLPDDPEVIIRRKIRAEMVRNHWADRPEKLEEWEKLYDKTKKGIRRVKYH